MRFVPVQRPVTLLGALVMVGWLGSVGCNDVKEIPLGQCGNGVLEPDHGEDCDSALIEEGTHCQPPGAPQACRYVCEDSGDTYPCPSGWGCGRDGICRAHAGTTEVGEIVPTPTGVYLDVADFDGDGLDDISWLHGDHFSVTHALAAGTLTTERAVTIAGPPTVADPNRDGRADWLLSTRSGLQLFRGSADRLPRPTMFQSIPLESGVTQFIPMDLVPDIVLSGDTPMAFAGDESLLIQPGPDTIAGFNSNVVLLDEVASGAGALLLAADFDLTNASSLLPLGSPTPEELVVANPDATEVDVYRPALTLGVNAQGVPRVEVAFNTLAPAHIQLPSGALRLVGAFQLNPVVSGIDGAAVCPDGMPVLGDDYLDIVIDLGTSLVASYGRGDGTFHSDPCDLRTLPADAADFGVTPLTRVAACCDYLSTTDCSEVLALGHLDDDGAIDVVTQHGVFTTSLAGGPETMSLCAEEVPHGGMQEFGPWLRVAIDDFDGDGNNDVMASALGGGLDYIAGSGGVQLTESHIPSGNFGATHLSVADFDADGIADLAMADVRADGLFHVSLVFGELLAPPSGALEIGTVDCLAVLEAFDSGGFVPEEADDLVVVRSRKNGDGCDPLGADVARTVGVVEGRTDRQLESNYIQAYSFSELDFFSPFAAAVGHFVAPNQQHAAFVSLGVGSFADPTRPTWALGLANIEGDVALPIVGTEATPIDVHGPVGAVDSISAAPVSIHDDGTDALFVLSSGTTASDALPSDSTVRMFLADASESGAWSVHAGPELAHAAAVGVGTSSAFSLDRRLYAAATTPQVCRLDAALGPSVVVGIIERSACTGAGLAGPLEEAHTVLYVLPAAFLEALSRGEKPTLPSAARITPPDGEHIIGFTCFNGNGDAAEELAVALLRAPQGGCGGPPEDSGALTARIATVSFEEDDGVGEFRSFVELDGAQVESLSVAAELPIVPIGALASGDVNGDGVDDLVLGVGTATLLLKGQPVNR